MIPNPDMLEDQKLFQLTYGHGYSTTPHIPDSSTQLRRRKLVEEEFNKEFLEAWGKCAAEYLAQQKVGGPLGTYQERTITPLAELGDAIADSLYVLIGTAYEYGLPIAAIWRAVQESNMAKLWTWQEWELRTEGDNRWQIQCTDPHTDISASSRHRRWVVRNEFGKIEKPPGFKPPDIQAIVRAAMAVPPKEREQDTASDIGLFNLEVELNKAEAK